jgi:hypothetical protein
MMSWIYFFDRNFFIISLAGCPDDVCLAKGGWSIEEKFSTDELNIGGAIGGFVFGIITLVESNCVFTQQIISKES